MKLDRLLAKHEAMGRKQARQQVIDRQVTVNGAPATRIDQEVDRFSHVEVNGTLVQKPVRRLHLMLYKPVGIVSATIDKEHTTAIDLIDDPDKAGLHIAGRLDRNTSGLLLLTNDGRWSKALMDPARKVPKIYIVETREPIPQSAIAEFAKGFYFHTEDITTLPAELVLLGERRARLTLHEGRYHQVKRMFHRIHNRVTSLHREQIASISLPAEMQPGECKPLTTSEIESIALT